MFSSSSESKERLIQLHDHMNKPMFSCGSVSCCIPRSVIHLAQAKRKSLPEIPSEEQQKS